LQQKDFRPNVTWRDSAKFSFRFARKSVGQHSATNGRNDLKPHPEKYKDIMRNGAEIDTRQGIKIIKISLKSVKVSKATQQ